MAIIPYWDNVNSGWDTVRIGGDVLPGLWEIECAPKLEVDLKKSAGKDGAHITDKGYEPARVNIRGRIGTPDDWVTWCGMVDKFHPRKHGGARNPLSIDHPGLRMIGVTRISIVQISTPRINRDGVAELSMEAVEFFVDPKPVQKSKNPVATLPDFFNYPPTVSYARAQLDPTPEIMQNLSLRFTNAPRTNEFGVVL